MLNDCLDVFKNMYAEAGENIILDDYVLAEGSYVLVKDDGSTEVLEISKNNQDKVDELYQYFAIRDYLSKLIDMNKPIDGKKVIHSNNYLSFFVKKENLIADETGKTKLTNEIINKYYDILSNPLKKYTDKRKKEMYIKSENQYGKVDLESLNKCKKWIEENVFLILDNNLVKKDKNYVKIFFEYCEEIYQKESNKYIAPNIFNSTDFNIKINEITYGLPNDNMGLNAKKPFLELKGRKNSLPYLISEQDAIIQKKFFDYLMNNASNKKRFVYIGEKNIECFQTGDRPKAKFSGLFFRLKKGKEVEIYDFDTVVDMNTNIKPFRVYRVIDIDYTNEKLKLNIDYDKSVAKIEQIEAYINIIFFNKYLCNNYFTDAKDIKLNDAKLKEILILNRGSLFNWFYKGNIDAVKNRFPLYSMKLIKNSLINGYNVKALEQYNLRYSIMKYFKGVDIDMADIVQDIKASLREKINLKDTSSINSDEEYYFAIGQVISYFMSLSKSANKTHAFLRPILNAKTEAKLKNEIEKMFTRYVYAINSKRFNNLYAMILAYKPQNVICEDLLIAGYLNSSLIYEKSEVNKNE